MPKNKHLLAIIALLSLGNVLACLAVIGSEKSNDRRIESLAGALDETRQQYTAAQATWNKDLVDRSASWRHQLQDAQMEQQRLHGMLEKVQDELRKVQAYVQTLQHKPWLVSDTKEAMPWYLELEALQKRVAQAEEQLKKMPPAPKVHPISPP